MGILYLIQQTRTFNLNIILLPEIELMILLVTVTGLLQLLNFVPILQLPTTPQFDLTTLGGRSFTLGVGAILGCMVGLTSVSSGSVFAIVLLTFFRLESQKLVGTDDDATEIERCPPRESSWIRNRVLPRH
ncbi:hypothetical protein [Neosynechococcus sphagnicola]|uniref:hypothetical protein n=1 Tax=Neosynechococcus sphagnicola TaxID=1501145 RepID=UPI00068CF96E|nr:hypothetical protein [Neosynechococcus sphagnicola]